MRIKPAVGSVVGRSDNYNWGQVLVTPMVYGVVEVADPEGISRQHGISLLTKLSHDLASEKDLNNLHILTQIAARNFGPTVNSLMLLLPVGKVIYLVVKGIGQVYLKRDGKLAVLVKSQGSISGEVNLGDTILAVSKGFTEVLTETELIGVFDHLPVEEVAEKLTILLHEKSGGTGAAALVFGVNNFITDEGIPDSEESEVGETPRLHEVPDPKSGRRPIFYRPRLITGLKLLPGKLGRWIRYRKNITRLAVGAALAFFIISVFLGLWRNQVTKKDTALARAMEDAKYAFDEGTSLISLNAGKGSERLREAKSMLTPFLARFPEKSPEGRELYDLYHEIDKNLTQAMHLVQVKPEPFYDVSLIRAGAAAGRISLNSDLLYVLDSATNNVYAVSVKTKSGMMLAGGSQLAKASYLASSGDNLFVFADKGIFQILTEAKKAVSVVNRPPEWGAVAAMGAYGGNVYLVDKEKGRIWKYTAEGNANSGEVKFSAILEYLAPDFFPDLSRAQNLAIDGSVWLTAADGKILKFTGGKEDSFLVQGCEPPLGGSLQVYTDDTAKNVYILDKQNKRVVVTAKDGLYLAQFYWDPAMGISDFAVSESEKKVFLVSEGKIWSFELQ